jgi:hypothetical protein
MAVVLLAVLALLQLAELAQMVMFLVMVAQEYMVMAAVEAAVAPIKALWVGAESTVVEMVEPKIMMVQLLALLIRAVVAEGLLLTI